jgi:adenine phosphoribosyltransferase
MPARVRPAAICTSPNCALLGGWDRGLLRWKLTGSTAKSTSLSFSNGCAGIVRAASRLTLDYSPLAFAPMGSDTVERLRAAVRDVPDFPKKGIVFKDITPILSDSGLFRASIDLFVERCRGREIDKIVGIDARGFVFGSAVAYELGVGFVPIRKRGKLPYKTEIAKYSLEYGEAEMEMHTDAVTAGERVVLVDDLLATGGTSAAAAMLIRKRGADVVEAQFLIELEFLQGRKRLEPTPITSFLKY